MKSNQESGIKGEAEKQCIYCGAWFDGERCACPRAQSESGEMQKTAPCHSSVVIPNHSTLDADPQKGMSLYWRNRRKTLADRRPGKTFQRSDGTLACDQCCFWDRCDERGHFNRESCPYCLGTGVNATTQPENDRQTTTEESPSPASPSKSSSDISLTLAEIRGRQAKHSEIFDSHESLYRPDVRKMLNDIDTLLSIINSLQNQGVEK